MVCLDDYALDNVALYVFLFFLFLLPYFYFFWKCCNLSVVSC